MSPFLTVREAAGLTGKSPSSIRRVIYPIIHDDQHPDRHHIQPSVEEALQFRLKGENFAWRLSEELLRREIPQDVTAQSGQAASGTRESGDSGGELLVMLRRELEIKNQQITQQSELIGRQMELISGLSERMREGNILMGRLQERLSLTDGREKQNSPAAEPKRSRSAPSEKGSKAAPKPAKKKGFFSGLFG